jgi:hypothetical protein
LGHAQVERALDDESDGAASDGVGGEVVPVRSAAGDAGEERARRDEARVVGQVGDLDGRGVDDARGADGLAQRLQLDGARF